ESQRRIDDAWTGAVGSSDLLLNRLDKLIAMPGRLGDELQDDQAKVAVGEEAAEASSASLPTMRTAVVVLVLAAFYAAEATAVALVMGMSVVHYFFPSVFRYNVMSDISEHTRCKRAIEKYGKTGIPAYS